MRRDLQTFCPKDCIYNSGSFCLLPFDTTCPHCTYSSGTSLFGSTRIVTTPYGRCPVCGAEGPCDVVAGEPTQVINYDGTAEYLFRCPKCHEVSWVRADRYEYTMEPVSIPDDINMVDDEKPIKTGTTCIICGEEYEIERPDDGHICEKCKSAIKRLREIFEDVDAESEELDSSEGTEDGTTTVGATTDEPMVITLYGDELRGDTDGDGVTWFIGHICEDDGEDEDCRERCEPDDEEDVYPMECALCDLYGKKPCVPNADGENGRCSHCTQDWCVRLEKEREELIGEDKENSVTDEEDEEQKEPVITLKSLPVMLKDFVARFIPDGMRVEVIYDDHIDANYNGTIIKYKTLSQLQFIANGNTLVGCPETLCTASVLTVRASLNADIAIYVYMPDDKKNQD